MAHCISCTTNQCVIVATCTNIDFFAFLVLTYTMAHCIISSSQEQHATDGEKERGCHMKYFNNCKTAEDVKQLYKKLARDLHPDCNPGRDTTKEFQEMQAEFDKAWNQLKNKHTDKYGKTYEKESTEDIQLYKDIIERLLHCPGLVIELCGSWLWITGNTKEHRETLKELHFCWSKQKSAWYFHAEPYRKHSKNSVDMWRIREMYGSQQFATYTSEPEAIAANM